MEISMTNALIPFADAANTSSLATATRQIRDDISHMLTSKPEVWDEISPNLVPEGVGGSSQFDHCIVSLIVKRETPTLGRFQNLNEKALWHHIEAVIRQRGYKMSRGYIIGHVSEDAAPAAPEKPVQEETQSAAA